MMDIWEVTYIVIKVLTTGGYYYHYEPKNRYQEQPPMNDGYRNVVFEGTLNDCVKFIERTKYYRMII